MPASLAIDGSIFVSANYELRRLKALIIGLVFLVPALVSAEVVLLHSGQTLSGQIAGQSATTITIVTDSGLRTIPKAQLVRIQYVPFTAAQKDQYLGAIRRKRAAEQASLQRIRAARLAEAEREKQLRVEEARIQAVREEEARGRAERAAALRELVDKGKMEKPSDEPISYWDFAWRSLVLPGWGHFKLERPFVGSLYVMGSVGLVAGAYAARHRATRAVTTNRHEGQNNFILSILPSVAALEVRTAYAYYANARAYLPIQNRVQTYHRALYSLGLFYAIQVLHIIYNGIAWENGLLIVENGTPGPGKIKPQFAVLPEESGDAGDRRTRAFGFRSVRGTAMQLGLSWSF